MKPGIIATIAACAFILSGIAYAQSSGMDAILVTNPNAYAANLSSRIALGRMEPIRQTFAQMTTATQLDVQTEASIAAFDRYLEQRTADRFSEIEDMTLGDSVRRIYYMHSFDGRILFTRYDFVRSSQGWRLSGLTFGSSWSSVATLSSPAWAPSEDESP